MIIKLVFTGKLEGGNVEKEKVEIVVRLKYLSNFCRTLDMPLINCEVPLTLTWSKNCVLTRKSHRRAVAAQGGNPRVDGINNRTGATYTITDCKLYLPVATLSAENDKKLLEQLHQDLKELLHGINIDQKCLVRL